MKENKYWLKDVRNRTSFNAVKAHLNYCQEDFRQMVSLKGLQATLYRTKDWNPLNLSPGILFSPHNSNNPPAQNHKPRGQKSRNVNSRHPKNTGKNNQWRSQIYSEMVRLGRSLQGTYQHLEQGKIARQERQMDATP
jgi:hypothetical protein